ncbi:MAG: radical SAM protein [Planctomycetota bacterium]|nr:radical SAM protein [Planctomycetota bacterium]
MIDLPVVASMSVTPVSSEAVDRDRPSGPLHRDVHLVQSELAAQLFVVEGSQIYDIDHELAARIELLTSSRSDAVAGLLDEFGVIRESREVHQPLESMPLRSLSLAVAQKCNLGCTYCYAEQGDFGGSPKSMPAETALAAVDRLFDGIKPGERVHLAFLGGEPLLNRPVIRSATIAAERRAVELGVQAGFAITTNGTLLEPHDADFFEEHGFAVTVSIDGPRDVHDQLRPFKKGTGSFDQIMLRLQPLLHQQRRMQVSARVTVTPRNLELTTTLSDLLSAGFHSVGFSPLLSSPSGRDELEAATLDDMLAQMIACGAEFEAAIVDGRRHAFLNMVNAMQELHVGSLRPYPCGAGAGYFGVSADGGLFACHRFVDDDAAALGDVAGGIDQPAQTRWLRERHVDFQSPCRDCWARYLCGGGCHHEVLSRSRNACGYIRGWLHYCLEAYARLRKDRPDYFSAS